MSFLPVALLLGYLLGSIPFGLVVSRLAGAPDPRTIGSQNIGATNVLRSGRKDLAAATLFCDAMKGTVAVIFGAAMGLGGGVAGALGAFLGHLFPVWLGFKGGKGVATFLGCLIALDWRVAAVFAAVWLGVAGTMRLSSLAALAASAVTPLFLFIADDIDAAFLYILLTILLIWKHGANIERLRMGTESRIGEGT